jgi:hypothetical protein
MPRGALRAIENLQSLRIAHSLVGLRPGKPLRLAIVVAGTRPDWRGVLGHYVQSYPELFEPVPAARKYEGMYGITNMSRASDREIARMKARGVTCMEMHGHFPEYGVYVTAEALKDPALTWRCRPHPGRELSLASNRERVAAFGEAGVPVFMYFYNVHANPGTIEQRFAADLIVSERGKPVIQYRGEPGLRAQPDSPFGKHLLEQMDLMLKAYPNAPGFFVDNYVQQMLGFRQDDGVTMVHHRPAYDMNRNHQVLGPMLFAKAHRAGKIIMINKLATIESARGVDLMLDEGMSAESMRMYAFANVFRAFFPLHWEYPRGPQRLERCLQLLLVWGGTPAETLYRYGREEVPAYRPLTDALIGKRWVFEADPLDLPADYAGQVFRIDRAAPHGGDVVVTLADLERSWREKRFTEDLSVTVRLPEVEQITRAEWLGVEHSQEKPRACTFRKRAQEMTIDLPPTGAAGVLRLSRQP